MLVIGIGLLLDFFLVVNEIFSNLVVFLVLL